MVQIPVHISADGRAVCIYDDAMAEHLAALRRRGVQVIVSRVSHVEPDNEAGNWKVDLSPIGGEVHYVDEEGKPFATRQDALDFELRMVRKHFNIKEGSESHASAQ